MKCHTLINYLLLTRLLRSFAPHLLTTILVFENRQKKTNRDTKHISIFLFQRFLSFDTVFISNLLFLFDFLKFNSQMNITCRIILSNQLLWYNIDIYKFSLSGCLGVWVFVCLFVSNKRQHSWTNWVKFCVGPHVTPGKVYEWPKF